MPGQSKTGVILLSFLILLSFFPIAMPVSFSVNSVKDPAFDQIPLQVGAWKGREVPVDQRTYDILETRNVFSRAYTNVSGEIVYLVLVGSHRDRRVAHPPEVCYLGSNFTITSTGAETISAGSRVIPLKKFTAEDEVHPERTRDVRYVYKVGRQFTTNYYAQQFLFVWNRLLRRDPKILLIRMSGSKQAPFDDFFHLILPYLP